MWDWIEAAFALVVFASFYVIFFKSPKFDG